MLDRTYQNLPCSLQVGVYGPYLGHRLGKTEGLGMEPLIFSRATLRLCRGIWALRLCRGILGTLTGTYSGTQVYKDPRAKSPHRSISRCRKVSRLLKMPAFHPARFLCGDP